VVPGTAAGRVRVEGREPQRAPRGVRPGAGADAAGGAGPAARSWLARTRRSRRCVRSCARAPSSRRRWATRTHLRPSSRRKWSPCGRCAFARDGRTWPIARPPQDTHAAPDHPRPVPRGVRISQLPPRALGRRSSSESNRSKSRSLSAPPRRRAAARVPAAQGSMQGPEVHELLPVSARWLALAFGALTESLCAAGTRVGGLVQGAPRVAGGVRQGDLQAQTAHRDARGARARGHQLADCAPPPAYAVCPVLPAAWYERW
jgi:hypothetical protein